jgi:hypothetical protein
MMDSGTISSVPGDLSLSLEMSPKARYSEQDFEIQYFMSCSALP